MATLGEHAVVLGGSMSGLLAARVLADAFERVTVVERDTKPARPEPRKGVPQGRHVHAILKRGIDIIEALFPGFAKDLENSGAVTINFGRDVKVRHFGGWHTRYDSPINLYSLTRGLLEWQLDERVRATPKLQILERQNAVGLDIEDGRVRALRVRDPGSETESQIEADLFVDAAGRGSPVSRWLSDAGYAAPELSQMKVDICYTTCFMEPPQERPDWKLLAHIPEAPERRGFFVVEVEDDRWLATMVGYLGDHPPTDFDGWLHFAAGIPNSEIGPALRSAKPISDIARHRFPASQHRRYDRLPRQPGRLLHTGDALCSFNPLFGQGMTVAAMDAECLGKVLAQPGLQIDEVEARFRREAGKLVERVWNGVAGEDLRHDAIAGDRNWRVRAQQWYGRRLGIGTHSDAVIREQFGRVNQFLDEPETLFSPRVIARTLSSPLRAAFSRAKQ